MNKTANKFANFDFSQNARLNHLKTDHFMPLLHQIWN